MIDCVSENIWYKKRFKNKRGRKKRLVPFLIFMIVFCGFFSYYRFVITDTVSSVCSDLMESISYECENKTINSIFDDIKYEDLVKIEKNSNGDITLVSINSINTNKIATEAANSVKIVLSAKIYDGIPIPFMAFSGLKLLSGYGSIIKYKALSVNKVYCDFSGDFQSVGINQTLNTVYIVISVCSKIHMPFFNKEIVSSQKIMISNSVIVGKIPEVYLNKGI